MKKSEILNIWMTLSEISNKNKFKLTKEFNGIEPLFQYVMSNKIHTDPLMEKLKYAYNIDKINLIMEQMWKENIKFITFSDENYPHKLKLIEDSPYGLFYKGNLNKLNKNINLAVVGSRRCTRYGTDVTNMIVGNLALYNVNIISGLAKGIDGIAHKRALELGMYTSGILGCGIDEIYPKENKSIYEEILMKDGCIISEFTMGMKPLSRNFPMRNRIISGISDLVLIVEGGEKSGTLITANSALEQGKDVMVVPGSVFSSESKGTNKLIRGGAHVFTEIEDILSLLSINIINKQEINKNIKNNFNTKIHEELCNLIDENPIHINDIIKVTNIDINQLYKLLFELQVQEHIICLNGNFYVRVNKKL